MECHNYYILGSRASSSCLLVCHLSKLSKKSYLGYIGANSMFANWRLYRVITSLGIQENLTFIIEKPSSTP